MIGGCGKLLDLPIPLESGNPRQTERQHVARINVPEGDGMEVSRLWSLAPDIGVGVHAFSKAVYEKASLPVREREVARMRIAQLNQCDI